MSRVFVGKPFVLSPSPWFSLCFSFDKPIQKNEPLREV